MISDTTIDILRREIQYTLKNFADNHGMFLVIDEFDLNKELFVFHFEYSDVFYRDTSTPKCYISGSDIGVCVKKSLEFLGFINEEWK